MHTDQSTKQFLNRCIDAKDRWDITQAKLEKRSEPLWFVNMYPRPPIYVGCIDGEYFAVCNGFQNHHKWYPLSLEQAETFNRSEILRADKALKLAEARQEALEGRIEEKSTNVPDKLKTSLDALTVALVEFNKLVGHRPVQSEK